MNNRNLEIEFARLIENILKKNNPITQVIAKVESPPPELTLKYSEQIIPSNQIYCSNYLLSRYHRNYTFEGIIGEQHQDVSEFQFDVSSSNMTKAGQGPHIHDIKKIGGSGTAESTGNYKHHGDLWLEDTLKVGDEVLVNIVGIYWVVVTKVTKMPSVAIEGV